MTNSPKKSPRILPSLGRTYQVLKKANPLAAALRRLGLGGVGVPKWLSGNSIREKANRAAAADLDWMDGATGRAGGWARTE